MQNKLVLVTGAAGFIGYHTTVRLLNLGYSVIGLDNLNDYYSVQLKKDRLEAIRCCKNNQNFLFQQIDLKEMSAVSKLFESNRFTSIVHLAAQPGVRYSLKNPQAYIDANIQGFFNIIEAARRFEVSNLLFASSSSVYGNSDQVPFAESQNVDYPISLYAATKKSNELMAYTYSHLFNIPATGLRFFTVYGPWGRPDMAVYSFTDAIEHGREIRIFRDGTLLRDFTYVDDIVEGIVRLVDQPAPYDQAIRAPYRIFNIGNHSPVTVNELVQTLEHYLGKSANISYAPMQPGDVEATFADVTKLQNTVEFSPNTPLSVGLANFVKWYRTYHQSHSISQA